MAPFIAKEHGLTLKAFVHSETQRGKSLLDAHFALAMMHISRYCNESRKDVTKPGDVVVALNSGGGVANCTAELVYVDREHAEMMQWVGAQKEKRICRLGRVNEVVYGAWQGEEVKASGFKLSGRSSVEYTIRKHSLQRVNDSASLNVDAMDEAEVEIEEGNVGSEELLVAEERVSRQQDYSYRSNITGIPVYTRARIRRQIRKKATTRSSRRQDRTIEETTDELLSEINGENYETDNGDTGSDDNDVIMFEFQKCKAMYRQQLASRNTF